MNIRQYLFDGVMGCSDRNCIVTGYKGDMCAPNNCKCLLNMSKTQLKTLSKRISSISDTKINKEKSNEKDRSIA